jgi:transcriptional regulator with XRE-family HTH domain
MGVNVPHGQKRGPRPYGLALRTLREETGLSLEIVATASGYTDITVGAIESGRIVPEMTTVDALLDVLDVTWPTFTSLVDRLACGG